MNDKLKNKQTGSLKSKKKGGVAIAALMGLIGLALIVSSCAGPRYGGHGGHHSYMQENDMGGYNDGQRY